jgi:hypothetical protein
MGCEVEWMVEWMLCRGEGVRRGRVSSRREREKFYKSGVLKKEV